MPRTTSYMALCVAGALTATGTYATDVDPQTSSRPPQSLSLDQVRESEAQLRARGEFGNGVYTTTHISAGNFVNDVSGTAPTYWSFEYRYKPATATSDNYRAQVSLPQGAKVCYIGIDFYDNDTSNNISATFATQDGFGDSNPPSGTYLDSVASNDAPTTHYGHASAMLDPYCVFSNPITHACMIYAPRCYTINNDIHDNGGKGAGNQYTVQVSIPDSATPSNLGFRGVDLRWMRQIAPGPDTATFTDVPTTHTFYKEVEALKASGITSGKTATTYAPDDTVTRGQMAAFLARALGLYWPD